MRARKLLTVGTALAILTMSIAAIDSAAGPLPEADDTTKIAESLHYLMSTYGLDKAEARRRLELQAAAPELADTVRRAVGEELLEVRLDQAGGGKLVFLTSQSSAARTALGQRFDGNRMRVEQSAHTAASLRAAEAAERAKVPGGMVPAPPIDPETQKNCTMACDTPMRGGVRLHVRRDNGSWGSCTSGFNVRDSSGWVYVLTAGHCATSPGPKRQYMYHNGLPAVFEKNASGSAEDPNSPADSRYAVNQPPGLDYAVLPYQSSGSMGWAGYWLYNRRQKNLVQSVCASSSYGCGTGTYPMVGMYRLDQMQLGWVVCATGTGTATVYPNSNAGYSPGTRCGEIQCKTMVTYSHCGGLPSPNLYGIKVNICSRPGDSGGPLFSQIDNRAYGILSGGPAGTGACRSGEYSVYAPLSQIFDRFNRDTGRGLSLITG